MAKADAPAHARKASRRDQLSGVGVRAPRNARQRIKARMAYSARCAHLRAMKTTVWIVSSDAWGNSQRMSGSMMRDERWTDFESPEAMTMTPAHRTTGSQ